MFLRRYGETDFITGLRAIAATMVVIVHTAAFADFGLYGEVISGAGKYGVHMFFVISGFTIAKTYTEASSYKSYLTRRMMRILPNYWFILTIAFLLISFDLIAKPGWMQEFGSTTDAYNYFMHITALSFLDYRVANSVLGVEWSIPIEIAFYIFLPLIIPLGKTISKTILCILTFLILTGICAYISKQYIGISLPVKWTPIAYGHLFILGVLSYHLRAQYHDISVQKRKLFVAAALVIFTSCLMFDLSAQGDLIAFSTALIIIFLSQMHTPILTTILSSRPFLFIGSISYSIYLIHYLIILGFGRYGIQPSSSLQYFAMIYCLTIMASMFTYALIEKPTNALGRSTYFNKLWSNHPARPNNLTDDM